MSSASDLFKKLRLQHLLMAIVLVAGTVPLAVNSFLLIRENRDLLKTQEKSYLTRSAEFLSIELNGHLVAARDLLSQLGSDLLAAPPQADLETKLRQPWLQGIMRRLLAEQAHIVAVRVLDERGAGPQEISARLPAAAVSELDEAFREARQEGRVAYRFLQGDAGRPPVAALAVPVSLAGSERTLFVEGAVELGPMESVFREEARGDVAVFLVGRGGEMLWSEGGEHGVGEALVSSDLIREFSSSPFTMTAEYALTVDGKSTDMVGRVSPVEDAGWGVVVQKPAAKTFGAVREMVFKTVLATAVLIALALALAFLAARKLGRPIQELTETSNEIAEGSFGQRVEISPVGAEVAALARNFNRMSGHVESYVDQLRQAAQANQDLFIGSMRAFVAAIDAKDPYTRGHSERVAAHSRTIARQLGLDAETQHKVWVGALLHDVGKIGVEDRILTKPGVLTSEEYEEMKKHPVIGSAIMSRIEQLRDMIPAIHWHHEAWNGKGYPDGLVGGQIPLMARIVGVADTFDAITTNRPYQRAYEPTFAVQKLRELAGQRFDAKVVTAFLRAFEAGEVQLRRLNESQTPQKPALAISG